MTSAPRHDDQVIVTTKGEVSEAAKVYAVGKVERLHQHAHGPVLLTRLKLTVADGEDHERRAVAEAALDVDGRLVRGQVAAHRVEEAVDLLVDRMIRQLDQAAEKVRSRQRRPGGEGPPRPARVTIPPEEREVVAHKTFAIDRATVEEAAFDMEVLDYDFFLFTDADDGRDKVVTREGGEVRTVTDPPDESVDEALERLDAGGEPFVFFCAADNGRGAVAYVRYDGHYGLIRPAD